MLSTERQHILGAALGNQSLVFPNLDLQVAFPPTSNAKEQLAMLTFRLYMFRSSVGAMSRRKFVNPSKGEESFLVCEKMLPDHLNPGQNLFLVPGSGCC